MQLTLEVVLALVGSAFSGATVAWLGSRVYYAELLGHVKKHCGELEAIRFDIRERTESADKRLGAHSGDIRRLDRQVAVLKALRGDNTEEN